MAARPPAFSERAALLGMVAATLLWGGTFIVTRDALPGVTVPALMLARFGVAALILGVTAALSRRRLSRLTLTGGLLCAPFIYACYALQAEGLRETTAGSSAFLTCAGTLAAPFFAWLLLRQRPSTAVFLGMGLALAGSLLLSWRQGMGFGRAETLTFAGSIAYAFQLVIVARLAPEVDPLVLTAVQSVGVALCALPFASPRAAVAALTGAGIAPRTLYLALAGSTVAPLLQVAAQRSLTTGRIAILFALEPVFALIFAATIGGERFVLRWWIGAGLILAAVVIAERGAAAEA
ncbi:MAG TPA: DMT family transporter [Candidatus Udaeobacter sp.]|jgi:drug/metabolite transporter (DMT)-like permease|nr:DMT family transporter [Candidatus Udaeobacter sp.]